MTNPFGGTHLDFSDMSEMKQLDKLLETQDCNETRVMIHSPLKAIDVLNGAVPLRSEIITSKEMAISA